MVVVRYNSNKVTTYHCYQALSTIYHHQTSKTLAEHVHLQRMGARHNEKKDENMWNAPTSGYIYLRRRKGLPSLLFKHMWRGPKNANVNEAGPVWLKFKEAIAQYEEAHK
ncbi:hypothetical protein LguiB_028772 [Lonicera macranthoides]